MVVGVAGGVVGVVADAVAFRAGLRLVEVGALSGEAAALLAEELARVEKASGALRAMAAARAADCGAHRSAGFADPDEWVARMTGASRARARSDLATGSRLADCPETRDAAVGGELSLGQADDIARTEREKPGSEGELVAAAKRLSHRELGEACRKRRHDGVDREELAARQRARRSFRSWIDGDGMQCALLQLEPVVGVALLARIQVEADRLHREARRQGSTEAWGAHAADAVASILASGLGWTPPAAGEPAAAGRAGRGGGGGRRVERGGRVGRGGGVGGRVERGCGGGEAADEAGGAAGGCGVRGRSADVSEWGASRVDVSRRGGWSGAAGGGAGDGQGRVLEGRVPRWGQHPHGDARRPVSAGRAPNGAGVGWSTGLRWGAVLGVREPFRARVGSRRADLRGRGDEFRQRRRQMLAVPRQQEPTRTTSGALRPATEQ